MPFAIGTKVVRTKNHKPVKYRQPSYIQPASVSREFGEVVDVNELSGRVRVKWTGRQWHIVGQPEGEIKPIGRNLRTWNAPHTIKPV